jgi:hypothetical protein
LFDEGPLVTWPGSQEGFVRPDVSRYDVDLAADVLDRPFGSPSDEHRFTLFSQLIGISPQLGQVRGVRLEVRASSALVADRAGLAAGGDVRGLRAHTHRHRYPTQVAE